MGSEGDSKDVHVTPETESEDVPVTPVVHIFGDEDLSDVTLIVGEEEFQCHKMLLAARSSYFKAMFFSNFKEKDQKKVTIQADPVAFKRLMELIYTAEFTGWEKLLNCDMTPGVCTGCITFGNVHSCFSLATTMWIELTALVELADLFDVRPYTVALLEKHLLSSTFCTLSNCPRSGAKLLIALTNDMQKFKTKSTASRNAVAVALRQISREAALTLNPANFEWILLRP